MPPERNSKHERYAGAGLPDFFLESFVGQMLYHTFKGKRAFYPEERDDFEIPERYYQTHPEKEKQKQPQQQQQQQQEDPQLPPGTEPDSIEGERRNSDLTLVAQDSGEKQRKKEAAQHKLGQLKADGHKDPESQLGPDERELLDLEETRRAKENKDKEQEEDPNIVDWYGPNDPANPMNWSLFKKVAVTAQLCLLTFSIYIGSAIYSPGYQSIMMDFGISQVVASLGLSLFVAGYAVGPLFLSAASEIPQVGRNPPYIITLALFVILQVPTALVDNLGGFLVLRFLAGFIGSPVLATGGASVSDMFGPKTRPIAIGIWGLAAVNGPTLGPLIGGFAIQAESWRWAFWILLWLDGFCLAVLIWAMPETSSNNILTRRAQRLRKRTGNPNLKSQGEIMGQHMQLSDIANMTLYLPLKMSITEPICFALNLYIGLIYAILYCFIESFSLVFVDMYGFNLGQNGLAYLGLFIGAIITYFGFIIYNYYSLMPKIRAQDGDLKPEQRLPIACFGSIFLPICLFWFGWTSNPSIHWIVPIIGSSFFSVGTFLMFQSVLNYLTDAYPSKAASVLAGNDFVRSSMGAAFPLFSTAMFQNLGHGVAWGSTLLGCLTVLFVPIPFLLLRYGRTLRMRSPYARHDI